MSGVAAIVALECGWIAEVVQPWIVYEVFHGGRRDPSGWRLGRSRYVMVLYTALGVATVIVLARWRAAGAPRPPSDWTCRTGPPTDKSP